MNSVKTKFMTLGIIGLLTIAMIMVLVVWQGTPMQARASSVDIDQGKFSAAVIDDSFCDSTILVVMTRSASQDRVFTPQDFPEVALSNVQCIKQMGTGVFVILVRF